MTRKITFNEITRRWQVIYPEDEGYNQAIEQVWSKRFKKFVTIPTD